MTLEQIVEETRHWPREQMEELMDRLALTLSPSVEAEIDDTWRETARRRLAEIEAGQTQAVPGDEVSARIRQIVGL